jgi:aspartyl protease family protein
MACAFMAPDPQLRRWGAGMAVAAAAIVLALLTALFQRELEEQRNPNRDPVARGSGEHAAEIVLQRNRQGHYLVNGEINGRPVEFLLDTGATTVAVPATLASRLGLKRGATVRMQTANGEVTGWLTRLDTVTIGPIRLENVRASIGPGLQDGQILLGMSALKRLEFAQSGDQLILRTR